MKDDQPVAFETEEFQQKFWKARQALAAQKYPKDKLLDLLAGMAIFHEQDLKQIEFKVATSKSKYFKGNGQKGGTARQKPFAELKAWTIEQYKLGEWPSIVSAALELRDSVLAQGRLINATLSPTNAHRTIQNWISEHNKNTV